MDTDIAMNEKNTDQPNQLLPITNSLNQEIEDILKQHLRVFFEHHKFTNLANVYKNYDITFPVTPTASKQSIADYILNLLKSSRYAKKRVKMTEDGVKVLSRSVQALGAIMLPELKPFWFVGGTKTEDITINPEIASSPDNNRLPVNRHSESPTSPPRSSTFFNHEYQLQTTSTNKIAISSLVQDAHRSDEVTASVQKNPSENSFVMVSGPERNVENSSLNMLKRAAEQALEDTPRKRIKLDVAKLQKIKELQAVLEQESKKAEEAKLKVITHIKGKIQEINETLLNFPHFSNAEFDTILAIKPESLISKSLIELEDIYKKLNEMINDLVITVDVFYNELTENISKVKKDQELHIELSSDEEESPTLRQ